MNDSVNDPPEPAEHDPTNDPSVVGGGSPTDEPPPSPYPDGPPGEYPVSPVDPSTTTGQTAALGYGLGPPPESSGGLPGHRAGPYPAGPPQPPQPQFGRRAPQRGPKPDADGYYPSDYYLGTDWTRVVVGGLATVALALGIIVLGFYLFDRFDPTDDAEAIPVNATPTPLALVAVFECAGERPAGAITAPETVLIAGRNGDSRWLAFRNPQAPPRQLWIAAADMPEFDPATVGIVSCASSPQEFPTPLGVAAPAPTPRPDDSPDSTGPTPTPLPAPTPVPQATLTPVPTAQPTPTASPVPTEPPPPDDEGDGGGDG